MTDTPAEPAEDQPDPENPRANYQRALQRVQNILRRAAMQTDGVDILRTEQDLAIRTCELSAMQTLLIRAGVFTAAELYTEAAIAAVNMGNRLQAALDNQPRIKSTN